MFIKDTYSLKLYFGYYWYFIRLDIHKLDIRSFIIIFVNIFIIHCLKQIKKTSISLFLKRQIDECLSLIVSDLNYFTTYALSIFSRHIEEMCCFFPAYFLFCLYVKKSFSDNYSFWWILHILNLLQYIKNMGFSLMIHIWQIFCYFVA